MGRPSSATFPKETIQQVSTSETPKSTRETVLNDLGNIQYSVSKFQSYLPTLITYLNYECDSFQAGRVSSFLPCWKELTHDREILSCVLGVKLEFDSTPVPPNRKTKQINSKESKIIEAEISKLLLKNVIEETLPEPDQILSPIFLVPKPDGSYRLILNLKQLNTCITYRHFKMDTLNVITKLVSKNCFMASVDLKDAYYSIPIAKAHRKYLRFQFKGQLYQYTCMPNGLSSCPRIFTKLLKPALTQLHKKGHIIAAYLGDLYIQGSSFNECTIALIDTIEIFTKLGFIIHPSKSVFVPATKIQILGFSVNSEDMLVKPTKDKQDSMIALCSTLLHQRSYPIRSIAQLIGKMVSLFPGSLYGPLYYRQVEREKTMALKQVKGNFEDTITLYPKALVKLIKHFQ